VFFLLTVVVLFEIGMADTKVHEMTVTLTIPSAIELRLERNKVSGVLSLNGGQNSFAAAIPITLCTNAPPTQLYMELPDRDPLFTLYYAVLPPGASPDLPIAWLLVTEPSSHLVTADSPGEHRFSLFIKVIATPQIGGGCHTFPFVLSARDDRGTKVTQTISLLIEVKP